MTTEGGMKSVTEQYLVDAMSFTEAEGLVTEFLTEDAGGEYKIEKIVKPRLAEVSTSDNVHDDTFYRIKIAIFTLDEKTGQERKTQMAYIVQADTLEHAIARFRLGMAGTVSDWTLTAVNATPIVEHITGGENK